MPLPYLKVSDFLIYFATWLEATPGLSRTRYCYLWNAGGPDDVQSIANLWGEYLRTAWTLGLSDNMVITAISVARLFPAEVKSSSVTACVGQVGGARAALDRAAVWHWDSEVDSPIWQQRWYRRPLPAAHITDGKLNEDGVNAWNRLSAITAGLFLGVLPESYLRIVMVRDGADLPGEPDPGTDYFLPLAYTRMARWVVKSRAAE